MKSSLISICLLLSGVFVIAAEVPREWTSVDGRKLQAVLRAASANDVTLLTGGKNVVLPVTRLSQADQNYVKQWLVADAKRASCFSIQILEIRTMRRETFFKSGSVQETITVENPEGTKMLAIPTDVIVQVKGKMLPPRAGNGNQRLEFANLRIIHQKRDKTKESEPAGPRWLTGGKLNLGWGTTARADGKIRSMSFKSDGRIPNAFEITDGKPIEFCVIFAIPADSTPTALTYEGPTPFDVPLN